MAESWCAHDACCHLTPRSPASVPCRRRGVLAGRRSRPSGKCDGLLEYRARQVQQLVMPRLFTTRVRDARRACDQRPAECGCWPGARGRRRLRMTIRSPTRTAPPMRNRIHVGPGVNAKTATVMTVAPMIMRMRSVDMTRRVGSSSRHNASVQLRTVFLKARFRAPSVWLFKGSKAMALLNIAPGRCNC